MASYEQTLMISRIGFRTLQESYTNQKYEKHNSVCICAGEKDSGTKVFLILKDFTSTALEEDTITGFYEIARLKNFSTLEVDEKNWQS